MRGKYITTNVLLACLSKPKSSKKDIHMQLRETIAKRAEIVREFEKSKKKQGDLYTITGKEAA